VRTVNTRTAALVRTSSGASFARAALGYTEQDPFAVTVKVVGLDEFVFARDLLADCFTAPAGEGDVRLAYDGDSIHVSLSAEHSWARMTVPAVAVHQFLEHSYQIVPPGSESVDVEEMLKALAG
jgi:hypothetical protein